MATLFCIKTRRSISYAFMTLVLALSLLACVSPMRQYPTSKSGSSNISNHQASLGSKNPNLIGVGLVYIAPVEIGTGLQINQANRIMFTEQFYTIIREQTDFELYRDQPNNDQLSLIVPAKKQIYNLAQQAGADSVLFLRVDRYLDREGSNLGTSQAAQVAMSMALYGVNDQNELWKSSFGYRDQALSENILKLADRSKQQQQASSHGWLSAKQLFSNGIRELAQKLRQDHVAAFQ